MRRMMLMAAIGVFVLGILAGCSSEDEKLPGPSNAEQFEILRPSLDAIATEILDVFADGYDKAHDFDTTMSGVGGLPRPFNPDVDTSYTFDYDYKNGWHISEYHMIWNEMSMDLVDSTKFTDIAGMPQFWPNELTTDGVRSIDHLDFDVNAAGGSIAMAVYGDLTFDGFLSAIISVDGLARIEMQANTNHQYGVSSADLTASVAFHNVTAQNDGNSCPEDGSMVVTISGTVVDYDDDGQRYTVNIDATATFQFDDDGTYDVVVLIGGSQFSYTFAACS